MDRRRRFTLLISIFALAAVAIRVPALNSKPLHTDEAVHAFKTGQLLAGEPFRYNPADYHGPLLHYGGWLSSRLHGVDRFADLEASQLRIVTALFGGLMLLWLLALSPLVSRPGLTLSAALMLLSPALVYYSRYFIMEVLLVCFYLGFMVSVMRYLARPDTKWMAASAVCLGLMFAAKETALIFLAAAGLGLALTAGLPAARRQILAQWRSSFPPWHSGAFGAILLAVFILLISGFGTDWGNVLRYVQGYGGYLERGLDTSVHRQPWTYYGKLLLYSHWAGGPLWSEGLIVLLALGGAVRIFRPTDGADNGRRQAGRFLAWSTLGGLVILSLVPYKTPWNVLAILAGAILLAGYGTQALLELLGQTRWRMAVAGLIGAALLHLGWQAAAASGRYAASPLNPYVYGHTSEELASLTDALHRAAAVTPEGFDLPLQIVAPQDDYWPLPWDLRKFTQVYWWSAIDTSVPPAPVIVAHMTAANQEQQEAAIAAYVYQGRPAGERSVYMTLFGEPVALRPGVFLVTYMAKDLHDRLAEAAGN